ncbi:MAG: hypothetical protein JXP34_27585 [Planctomycetes bacterium]|nr:hypothetical protein [Planctomycetota bacterium]
MIATALLAFLAAVPAAGGPIDETTFADPPATYGPHAFWFWMCDLPPERIVSQIEAMAANGVGGFCIHARVGLSPDVGYLTPAWFERVKLAVRTAKRLGLDVWLYDEGMYPSGAANGMVVEGHPEFRCSALAWRETEVAGPAAGAEIPRDARGSDETWVATWAAPKGAGAWRDLSALAREGKRWDVPEGRWRVVTFFRAYPNSPIRGMGFGPEPLAADLLSPAAMERFIRLTHERYFEACGEEFGRTVKGIFTDEPSLTGRGTGRYRDVRPWTDRFAAEFRRRAGYDLLDRLPALWFDMEPGTEDVRWDYETVLSDLFDQNYYGRLSRWCEAHGIALMGHPSGYGEMAHERFFQIPGQDIVWRQVTPEKASSVLGKVSSSAEHIYGRARNMDEVYGAYGWELTSREVKWLCDWLCVRGVNLHMLHAFYSSLEGDRKFERPPDVGFGNLWWPHYRLYSDYLRRVAYATTRGDPVIRIAVFDHRNRSPERAAWWLLRLQRDFDYLEERVLREKGCDYRVLILDDPGRIAPDSLKAIERFAAGGGQVIARGRSPFSGAVLINGEGDAARTKLGAILDRILEPDIRCDPPAPDLRSLERAAPGQRIFFLTNESIVRPIRAEVSFLAAGAPSWWDPSTGAIEPVRAWTRDGDRARVPIELDPYEGRILVFREGTESPSPARPDPRPTAPPPIELARGWRIREGDRALESLGSWTRFEDLKLFSGTLTYEIEVEIPEACLAPSIGLELDLGDVREFAQVEVNGEDLGAKLWPPFRWDIAGAARIRTNRIVVRVTNTLKNRYDKEARESGLLGPVVIRPGRGGSVR